MWPYGYTHTDTPSDMTADDHAAFVALGKRMAAIDGYHPEQASDLYISSGTSRDWLYGTYRIFAFTIEMSPDAPRTRADEAIAGETGRNKGVVLDLLEQAGLPVRGRSARRRRAAAPSTTTSRSPAAGCVNADGTDTATSGAWSRSDPAATKTSLGTQAAGHHAVGDHAPT